MIEQLESRRMLAVTAYASGGTLVVDGDSAGNWINITHSDGIYWVNVWGGNNGYTPHISDIGIYGILIRGGGGNDILTVAQNITVPTTIYGGAGADYLVGGGGESDLWGHGAGTGIHDADTDDGAADILISGRGTAYLWGQDGNDTLYTDVYQDSGTDYMFGGNGHDQFHTRGHDGNAWAVGEAGNDSLIPYQHATQNVDFEGGSGTDQVNYYSWTAGVYVRPNGSTPSGLRNGTRLQVIHNDVEIINGTNHDDHFSDTNSSRLFNGFAGDDLMYGYGGNDTLNGLDGDDTIYGDGGNDLIHGGDGNDVLSGGVGNDTVDGSYGADEIYGDSGNDSLLGGAGTDWIYGGAGNDILVGGADSDYLHASDGVFGNDLIYGDNQNGTGSSGAADVAISDRWQNIWDLFIGVESVAFVPF